VTTHEFYKLARRIGSLTQLTSLELAYDVCDLETILVLSSVADLTALRHLCLWGDYSRVATLVAPDDPDGEITVEAPIVPPSESLLTQHSPLAFDKMVHLTQLTSLTLVRWWAHTTLATKILSRVTFLVQLDLRSAYDDPSDKRSDSEENDEMLCRCDHSSAFLEPYSDSVKCCSLGLPRWNLSGEIRIKSLRGNLSIRTPSTLA
jgi:hypothetical protein